MRAENPRSPLSSILIAKRAEVVTQSEEKAEQLLIMVTLAAISLAGGIHWGLESSVCVILQVLSCTIG